MPRLVTILFLSLLLTGCATQKTVEVRQPDGSINYESHKVHYPIFGDAYYEK